MGEVGHGGPVLVLHLTIPPSLSSLLSGHQKVRQIPVFLLL